MADRQKQEVAPQTIGNPDEPKKNLANLKKSKTNELEARSADMPAEFRRAYATKIWALLVIQLFATFVLTCIIEWKAPWIENMDTRQRIFIALSFFAMVQIGILFAVRDWYPFNFIIYFSLIPGQACLWGSTRYIIKYQFNCNLTGIIVVTIFLSFLENILGIHDCLGKCLKPGGANNHMESTNMVKARKGVQPTGPLANAMKSIAERESVRSSQAPPPQGFSPEEIKQRLLYKKQVLRDETIADLHHINDGIMRATMLCAFVNWFIASCICVAWTNAMQKQVTMKMHEYVHPASAFIAAVCAFFIIMFFHFDCERVQRRCTMDDYLRPVCHINADIVVAIFALYTVAFLAAVVAAGADEAAAGAAEGA